MQKAKVKGEVNVYLELLNYCGDITDSCLVGTFRNMNWARLMQEKYNERESDKYTDYSYTRLRAEEVE